MQWIPPTLHHLVGQPVDAVSALPPPPLPSFSATSTATAINHHPQHSIPRSKRNASAGKHHTSFKGKGMKTSENAYLYIFTTPQQCWVPFPTSSVKPSSCITNNHYTNNHCLCLLYRAQKHARVFFVQQHVRLSSPPGPSPSPCVCSQVTLDRSIVGYPALIGMTDFSHVWLVFVFHDNTNATVNGVVEERPAVDANPASAVARNGGDTAGERKGEGQDEAADDNGKQAGRDKDAERWGGGAREYRPPKHKLRQTFLTKVW